MTSIPNFLNKIKDYVGIDKSQLLLLLLIVLTNVASFGLGKLSISTEVQNNVIIKEEKNLGDREVNSLIKAYVASKNGKMYYPISCNGANKIKEENKVWFSSAVEAEEAGYQLATSCK